MPNGNYGQKIKIIVFIIILAIIMPISAHATPPKDIQLAYFPSEQMLSVTITHASFMPGIHYIKTVDIIKNGQKIISKTYDSQPDKNKFTYTYKISASSGDSFEVTGICSIYGSKTVKLDLK